MANHSPTRVLLRSLPVVLAGALIQAGLATVPVGATGPAAPTTPRVVVHGPGGTLLPTSAFPGALPSFQERHVSQEQAWEPTIGFGPDGTAYFMAAANLVPKPVPPASQPGGLHQEVWRSLSQGRRWTEVTPHYLRPHLGTTERPLISGDPYLWADPRTGWVFSYQQQAYLLCDDWAVSPTRGRTWRTSATCRDSLHGDSFGDHPTITTGPPRAHATIGYPNVLTFCSSSGCRASLDAASTWGPWTNPFPDCPEDLQLGHVKAASDGTLYLPRKACGGAMVAVSEDDGQTWRDTFVDRTVWTHSAEGDPFADHDGAVATDNAGNAYYFWLGDDRLPYLSVSRDIGRTWSAPMAVGAPGVTYALFPEITAAREGRIAFTYLGTTVPSGSRDDPDATWSQYVGFSLDALAGSPVFATTTAHDAADPIRRGSCINYRCYVAPGPEGNGVGTQGVGDFLDIQVNPATGAVWVALSDLCNGACARPDGSADDPAYSRAAVGVQVSGSTL
ncbi:MAG TPA: sialidase family protein [Actinomycetota bacterium]|nr:sialidase family protein [Actinomycetota bacterium]